MFLRSVFINQFKIVPASIFPSSSNSNLNPLHERKYLSANYYAEPPRSNAEPILQGDILDRHPPVDPSASEKNAATPLIEAFAGRIPFLVDSVLAVVALLFVGKAFLRSLSWEMN
jgi:hypothetical protein